VAGALVSSQPWSFAEAFQAHQGAEQEQRRVESEVTRAYKEHARAKKLAAVALARRIWELKADGIAVTACETLARGDPKVAELVEERDSKEGLKETAKVAAWRVNADRRDVNDLLSWSMRRDLAEYYGPSEPEPAHMKTFGGR
jgi:hypothetical protein